MPLVERDSTQDSMGVDLTPMLDVVFIMLIFFIVTASFVREASIELERPQSSNRPATEIPQNLIVMIDAENRIVIDGRRIDRRSLRAYAERHRANFPDSAGIIVADSLSKTATIIGVADAMRQAGMLRISIDDRL